MILLEVDPNLVQPGWTALIVMLLLALAMVVLFFSMRKQVRRITVPPTEPEEPEESDESEESEESTANSTEPTSGPQG
jgi:flagellar biosynthesis/type III secretory pathway M-ring protein FliF/YscJ